MSRRSLFAATGAVLSVALAACTANDPLAQQAAAGDNKGFVAGDGSVTEYALAKRSDPVEFSGKLFDGTTITAASVRGKVTILNFWYAACSPCRLEAPSLQSLYSEFKAQGVDFFGVDIEAGDAELFFAEEECEGEADVAQANDAYVCAAVSYRLKPVVETFDGGSQLGVLSKVRCHLTRPIRSRRATWVRRSLRAMAEGAATASS